MSGIKDRLDYLEETKSLIKNAINSTGGSLTDETAFKDYPAQVQHIIDTTIISQETLDNLINVAKDINGNISISSDGELSGGNIGYNFNVDNIFTLSISKSYFLNFTGWPITSNKFLRNQVTIINNSDKAYNISDISISLASYSYDGNDEYSGFISYGKAFGPEYNDELILNPKEEKILYQDLTLEKDIPSESFFLKNLKLYDWIGSNPITYEEVSS